MKLLTLRGNEAEAPFYVIAYEAGREITRIGTLPTYDEALHEAVKMRDRGMLNVVIRDSHYEIVKEI